MGSISKILDLDESSSPKSPVSSDNGFESFDATSSPEHSSANMTKISTEFERCRQDRSIRASPVPKHLDELMDILGIVVQCPHL